jgi:hypothetical protein
MSDYPPPTEELIEQLARVRDLAAKLPRSMQSVHKDLAELYKKVKRAQEWRPYPPETIGGE